MRTEVATRSHRLTIGLLVGLVVVLAAGSTAALAVARHQHQTGGTASPDSAASRSSSPHPSAAPSTHSTRATSKAKSSASRTASSAAPVTAAPQSSDATGPQSSDASDSATAAATVAVPESDPTAAPVGPSNNLTVQMSPSVRSHASAADVEQLLQAYFDAINQHNYTSWTQTVTTTLASHQSNAAWLDAYATTVDSSIWMQSMRDDPMQVQLRFTSQQDPDLAPKDMQVDCIHWVLTYQLATQDGHLAISSTVNGSVSYTKC